MIKSKFLHQLIYTYIDQMRPIIIFTVFINSRNQDREKVPLRIIEPSNKKKIYYFFSDGRAGWIALLT